MSGNMRPCRCCGMLIVAICFAAATTALRHGWADEPADAGAPAKPIQPTNETVSAETVATWIRQLGDDKFDVRESASEHLSEMGLEVRPALEAAFGNPDMEVRDRAYNVLKTIVEADAERRWTAFIEDISGAKHDDVPGWSRFRQVAGHDRTARQLFVNMHHAEPDLFKAIDEGPAAAAQSLQTCIDQEILQSPMRISGGKSISLASVCAMFFVGSDSQVTLTEGSAIQLNMAVSSRPTIRTAIVGGGHSAATARRVLGGWLSRDATASVMYQKLALAMQLDLKEGLEPAVHALHQSNKAIHNKQIALAIIVKFGGGKELPDVESCMNDSTLCATMVLSNQQQSETQFRDMALAAEIELQRQDPKAFGFDRLDSSRFPYDNAGLFGFRSRLRTERRL